MLTGMLEDLDDWFFDMDSSLTTDDLIDYFNGSLLTNGGDMGGTVECTHRTRSCEFKGNRRCLSNGRNTIYGSGNITIYLAQVRSHYQ